MKWFFILVALLLTGCVPKVPSGFQGYYLGRSTSVSHKYAQKNKTNCYVEAHGIIVYHYDRLPNVEEPRPNLPADACPPKDVIEHEIDKLLSRFGAPNDALIHTELVFVDRWLDCGKVKTDLNAGRRVYGCTDKGTRSTVRLSGTYWLWGDNLAHELSHILLFRADIDSRSIHFDFHGELVLIKAYRDINSSEYALAGTKWDGKFANISWDFQ